MVTKLLALHLKPSIEKLGALAGIQNLDLMRVDRWVVTWDWIYSYLTCTDSLVVHVRDGSRWRWGADCFCDVQSITGPVTIRYWWYTITAGRGASFHFMLRFYTGGLPPVDVINQHPTGMGNTASVGFTSSSLRWSVSHPR